MKRLGLNKVDAIDYHVQSGQSKQRPVDITHAQSRAHMRAYFTSTAP